jgi:hypothetical protein
MKIAGKVINGPKEALLVLPRQDGDIAFRFVAVLDDDDFQKLCPRPTPPKSMKPGVGIIENVEDPKYKAAVEERGELRSDWFFLQSIKPSEIEWEMVKLDDPSTWKLWREELKKAGFNMQERDRIYVTFLETNTVSDGMVDEARARFLASQQAKALAEVSSQTTGQPSSESGVPANVGG